MSEEQGGRGFHVRKNNGTQQVAWGEVQRLLAGKRIVRTSRVNNQLGILLDTSVRVFISVDDGGVDIVQQPFC